jgi:hypothetical protein
MGHHEYATIVPVYRLCVATEAKCFRHVSEIVGNIWSEKRVQGLGKFAQRVKDEPPDICQETTEEREAFRTAHQERVVKADGGSLPLSRRTEVDQSWYPMRFGVDRRTCTGQRSNNNSILERKRDTISSLIILRRGFGLSVFVMVSM